MKKDSVNSENKITAKSGFFILLSLAISLVITLFGAWLKSTSGFNGFLKFNRDWQNVYNGVLFSSWLPVIFMLVYAGLIQAKPKTAKTARALSLVYSAILLLCTAAGFFYVSSVAVASTSGLAPISILPAGNSLEDRSLYAKKYEPLLRIGISSDPMYGDPDAAKTERTATLQNMKAQKYDAVFILGNLSHFGLDTEAYREAADEISEIMEGQPVRFVMGGRDALINNRYRFARNFCGNDKEPFYRIDAGPVHLIVLNLLYDTAEFTAKQKDWLIKQLENIQQTDTTIVLCHSYMAASGTKTSTGKIAADSTDILGRVSPILEKYHVDLVVSGRNHFMEYLEKHDVSYAVVGTLGAPLEKNITYFSPYSKWIDNTHYGWLEVEVYTDFFIMTFYSSDGQVVGQLSKDTVIEQ